MIKLGLRHCRGAGKKHCKKDASNDDHRPSWAELPVMAGGEASTTMGE
jgi:hypothetical protein